MESWHDVVFRVLRLPAHEDLVVTKSAIANPIEEGFARSIGDPQGQIADFRKPLPDGRCIHVREFAKHLLVHWDNRDPSLDPIGHLVQDVPHIIILLSLFAIGVVGLFIWLGGEKQ